ncbi:tail fiber domain-containing protein [Escherichia coli]
MPIDERTPRLDLEKPAQANTLKNDVERLRDSLDKLDEKVAMLDPATGKIQEDQIADSVARLTPAGLLRDEQIPTKIPLIDQNGFIPASVIPHDAKTNLYDVSSEVLMLDLDASLGDIARITQPPYSRFILTAPDATQRENWREIPLSAVTSVNNRTGDITVAEAGVNNDITGLTALSGPLTLGGDAAGDYDAVTLRQLKASSGGAAGANMNGVMNNFIGAVEWFNGYRTSIPAGYIAADGQLESRTDPKTADLWAAVNSGFLMTAPEATWIAGIGHRAKYTVGDGSTKFRVPDLNGVQKKGVNGFTGDDSINALFLRGDGLISSGVGSVGKSKAPNLRGGVDGNTDFGNPTGNKATNPFTTGNVAGVVMQTGTAGASSHALNFDASRVSSVYVDGAQEINPNYAAGIWIIRASGVFQAANTVFNVITSDPALPAANVVTGGGQLRSEYYVSGNLDHAVALQSTRKVGGDCEASLQVHGRQQVGAPDKGAAFRFGSNGVFYPPAGIILPNNTAYRFLTTDGLNYGVLTVDAKNIVSVGSTLLELHLIASAQVVADQFLIANKGLSVRGNTALAAVSAGSVTANSIEIIPASGQAFIDFHHNGEKVDYTHRIITHTDGLHVEISGGYGRDLIVTGGGRINADSGLACRAGKNRPSSVHGFNVEWNSASQMYLWIDDQAICFWNGSWASATSDRELKENIVYQTDAKKALNEVNAWKPASFVFKERGFIPKSEPILGFIANDLRDVTPEAVTGEGLTPDDDIHDSENFKKAYAIKEMALIAKLTLAVQALTERVAELEAKLES